VTDLVQTRFLRQRLATLDAQIASARGRIASGAPDDRIDAHGDLEVLRRRRDSLDKRMNEIEAGVDTPWERVGAEMQQDIALLEDDLKRWMDGLDG
jgi:hypothetical protein